MHRITILYPNGDDTTFDFEYYKTKHLPMVVDKVGAAAKSFEVAKGVGGLSGKAEYIAIGTVYVESLEAFQKALAEHGAEVMADVPNYTNAQPSLQFDEIV